MAGSYRWRAGGVSTFQPDQDLCPGSIAACPHCQTQKDCLESGGSTFTVSYPGLTRETTGEC